MGFEPTTLRSKGIHSTNAPPRLSIVNCLKPGEKQKSYSLEDLDTALTQRNMAVLEISEVDLCFINSGVIRIFAISGCLCSLYARFTCSALDDSRSFFALGIW